MSKQLDLLFNDTINHALRYILTWPQWHLLLIIDNDNIRRAEIGLTWARHANAATISFKSHKSSYYNCLYQSVNRNFFINDIDYVGYNEEKLFYLLDEAMLHNRSLMLACASLQILQTAIKLQDLKSRLIAMPCMHLDK